ncbi:PQQ-dependent sugar dehydrogenase [Actinoallomurus sp. NPDC052274]|uniref:PQQ-dependent sugar dehydrogenase n=1 Tax=Actinoallomurus sp. NPDC052274 TaxID=3155420 RepID=UPI003434D2CE
MKKTFALLGSGALVAGLLIGTFPAHAASPVLLSQNRPVTASSEGGSGYVAKYAVDGDTSTRWASVRASDPQWIYVDLGATAQISEVKLVWDLSCATAYRVQISGDHSTWTDVYSTASGDGGTDDLTGLTGSGRYVRVYGTKRCRNTSGYGYSLRELQVYGSTGGDTQAPTTPGDVHSTGVTSDSVTLAWAASTDDVGVAAYDIYNDGNKISEAAGTATSKTITGLTPKTQYRLTVFARDAAGNVSPSSNSVTVTTAASSDTEPPTAPANLRSTGVTSGSVSLAWDASTDNVGVTGYDVYSGGTAIVTGVKTTSTTISGLAANTSYTFTVRAKDAGNNVSGASNAVTVKTGAASGGGVPSSITTVSSGWTIPWGMSWLPDGSALITERDSFKVFKLTQSGARTQVGTVPNVVTTDGEGGLLGVAVSPNWGSDHYVYLMHTASEGNRIVRMTYDGSSLSGYKVLVQGIKKNRYHNGGRLKFGPDGYLYATTGEAQTPDLAQDKSSLNGKILRMTTDGKPAPGNPFGTLVYSYGHRNPQGITWDPQGRLWEAEFGNSKYDEVNLIEPGKNYGWPTCEGKCSTSGMTDPKVQWSVSQASPSDITYADGALYVAALRGQRLWRIPVDGTTTGTPAAYYVNTYGRLRTVETIPGKNALWLSTTNCDNNGGQADGSDKVFRIDLK